MLSCTTRSYDVVNIDLCNKPSWFSGSVPRMQFEDRYITDSVIISEYLDEAYCDNPGNRLLSTDAYGKAKQKMLMEAANKVFSILIIMIVIVTIIIHHNHHSHHHHHHHHHHYRRRHHHLPVHLHRHIITYTIIYHHYNRCHYHHYAIVYSYLALEFYQ